MSKVKKDNLESVERDIKRLEEKLSDKSHGGPDSTKTIQKLTELYSKRKALSEG